MNALELRDSIRRCTNCDLHKPGTTPVPWSGRTPTQIAVLGQAPGATENKHGQPFIGPAGHFLRSILKSCKINPDLIAYVNPVCCYPGKGKGGDAKPTTAQLNACRPNLLDQISVIQPRYLVTLGEVALHSLREDLKVSNVHGKPLFYSGLGNRKVNWGGALCPHVVAWPTYHPAAAMRNPKYEFTIKADLAAFWQFRSDERWPEECYTCGGELDMYDSWGVGLCERHKMKQAKLDL